MLHVVKQPVAEQQPVDKPLQQELVAQFTTQLQVSLFIAGSDQRDGQEVTGEC